MTLVKQGFKETVMPSVIKNSTSDECDPIPLYQVEGQGGHNRLGLLCPGGGFQIDVIL